MAWLTSRRKKSDDAPVAVLEPETSHERLPLPTGPSLAVLVPDIAGISSFRFSLVRNTDTAEQQIIGLRPDVRRGTHAFWALHDEPNVSDDTHVEALVLIRASENSDVVYVVSFLDLESALSFTRFEVRRGLSLGNVMVYWAAFAQVREDATGVTVTPRTAPSTKPSWPTARDETFAPAAEAPVAESTPASPAPTAGVATETNEAIERYLRERGRQEMAEADLPAIDDALPAPRPPTVERRTPAPRPPDVEDRSAAIEPPAPQEPAVTEDSATITPPPAEATPIAEPIAMEDPVELVELEMPSPTEQAPPLEAVESPAPGDVLFSPIPEEQAAIEEAVVFQHRVSPEPLTAPAMSLSPEAIESGMILDEAAQLVGPVEAFTGDEELTDSIQAEQTKRRETELERLFAAAEVRGIPGDEELERAEIVAVVGPDGEIPLVKPYDEFNIAYEVERLLRNRRWTDKREGDDFDGFKSPPGRF